MHIQLTRDCNLRCPSCYVASERDSAGELELTQWMSLLDQASELGVFQIAFGGGEPLLSPWLVPLAQHAGAAGMLPNVTTNGVLLTEAMIERIRPVIGEVRLSVNDGERPVFDALATSIDLLRSAGVRFGFNLIVTHGNLGRIEALLRELTASQPSAITLIRPKPAPGNLPWYADSALSARDMVALREQLMRLEPLFEHTALSVDCAFSCLFRGLPEHELVVRGVAGCAMGDRFVVVSPDGQVYPCSHLCIPEFAAGDVKRQSLRDIWLSSPALAHIRDHIDHVDGQCRTCAQRRRCAGCRAIAWRTTGDIRAADRACPADSMAAGRQQPY